MILTLLIILMPRQQDLSANHCGQNLLKYTLFTIYIGGKQITNNSAPASFNFFIYQLLCLYYLITQAGY